LIIQFQFALSLVSLHKHAEHVPGHVIILSRSIQSTVLQLGFAFRNLATHEFFDSRTRSAQSVEPPETGRIQCQEVFGTRSSKYLGMGNFHTHFGTRIARALSSETIRMACGNDMDPLSMVASSDQPNGIPNPAEDITTRVNYPLRHKVLPKK